MANQLPSAALSQQMAFLSDIRGNLPALEAVLAEVARRAITEIYVAGDHILGGPNPQQVWARLVQVNAKMTRGVQDIALFSMDPKRLSPKTEEEKLRAEIFIKTREALGELVIARLRKLPEQIRVPLLDGSELVMQHGSPADPLTEITHDMDEDELIAALGDDPADIVVCGGAYVPFERDVANVHIINVGAVSIPGLNTAHFVIASPRGDGTLLEQCTAEY